METSDVSLKLLPRYYVYVLYSQRDTGWYIGCTADLIQRIHQHELGEVISTKYRRPLKLIDYEFFITQHDAFAREEYLKSGYGRAQLKKMLGHTLVTT